MNNFESESSGNKVEIDEKAFIHDEGIKHGKWIKVHDDFLTPDGRPYPDGLYEKVSVTNEHGDKTCAVLVHEGKIVDAINIKGDYPASAIDKAETIWVGRVNEAETLRNIRADKWKIDYENIGKYK